MKPEDAMKEVLQILKFYASVYKELLAVLVIRDRKTNKEKFIDKSSFYFSFRIRIKSTNFENRRRLHYYD